MSIVITPGYSWTNGETVTPTKLNLTANPTIAGGQAASFGSLVVSSATLTNPAPVTGTLTHLTQADGVSNVLLMDSFASSPIVLQRRADGTSASPSALVANDVFASFQGRGYGATGYGGSGSARLDMVATQTWTDSAMGAKVQIVTTPNGSTSAATALTLEQDQTMTVPGIIKYSGGITRLASNFTVSSITPANVPGLTFNVAAAGVYLFKVGFGCTQTVAGGYGFGIGGTATYTNLAGQYLVGDPSTAAGGSGFLSGGFLFTSFAWPGPDSLVGQLEGTFTVNAAGTVTFQFSQFTGSGSASVLAGAYFSLYRIS